MLNNIWLIVHEASEKLELQSFTLWLSGRAGIVEVQVPSISPELAQSSLWQPATRYLVDSFVKFDTLMSFLEKSCEVQLSFNG